MSKKQEPQPFTGTDSENRNGAGRPKGSYSTMLPYFIDNMPVGSTLITTMSIKAICLYESKHEVVLSKQRILILTLPPDEELPVATKAYSVTIMSRGPKPKRNRRKNVNPD